MYIEGIKVIDAKRPIKITVIADDLKCAKRKSPGECVAAQSIMRFKGCKKAYVFKSRTYILTKRNKWIRFQTSRPLYMGAMVFDKTGEFDLGTYTISPVNPSARVNGKRQGSVKPKGAPRLKPGAKHRTRHVIEGTRDGFKLHAS